MIKRQKQSSIPFESNETKRLRQSDRKEFAVVASVYGKRRDESIEEGAVSHVRTSRSALSAKKASWRRKKFIAVFLFLAGCAVLGIALFDHFVVIPYATHSLASGFEGLEQGVAELKDLNVGGAEEYFSSIFPITPQGDEDIFDILSVLIAKGGGAAQSLEAIMGDAIELTKEIAVLRTEWASLLFDPRGSVLLPHLEALLARLTTLEAESKRFASFQSDLRGSVPLNLSAQLPIQLDVGRLREFMASMIEWLSSPRRIVVFFENPSELRPGGGFIGSYAEVVMENGKVKSITVRDVSEPDRTLQRKVIPPKPLQVVTESWGAADANWFLDFPSSAAQVISFLEESDFYRGREEVFDAAVGVSGYAVQELLREVGPIILEDGTVLSHGSALSEIQSNVMNARKEGVRNEKIVLESATDALFAKLLASDFEKRGIAFDLIKSWAERREIVFYAKHPALQSLFKRYDIAGDVVEIPQIFSGDYLAVSFANLASGKSDLFMKQHVLLQSQLWEEGRVQNHLVITRTHGGNVRKESWYKNPYKGYVEIFAPLSSQIEFIQGLVAKTVPSKTLYLKKEYSADAFVSAIEGTAEDYLNFPGITRVREFGKHVFGGWVDIKAGEKKTITVDYGRSIGVPFSEGSTYTFIFEKQRGSKSTYQFEISAPPGYKWKENNLPVYEYTSDDPPGRVVIPLTLRGI